MEETVHVDIRSVRAPKVVIRDIVSIDAKSIEVEFSRRHARAKRVTRRRDAPKVER